MTIKNLSKFLTLFLFFFLFFPRPIIAQSPIQCGLLGEFCCNLAGSEPNSCKENAGLMCQNGRCVSNGTTPNPLERTGAVNSNSLTEAYPKIGFPCDDTNKPDPDFHSLRPYQGAICGDADKASFCSNELKFIESFNVVGMGQGSTACKARGEDGTFDCNPNFTVDPHDLYVELTDSMFPILGNTEQVTNSQGGTEQFDDAQKVNEYVSWYLSGVNNKAEYGENTDKKVVDFSGPVQKLLPKLIQEAERIQTISNVKNTDTYFDEEEQKDVVGQPLNHDQIVVCEDNNKAVPCPDGKELRLNDWGEGKLSTLNTVLNVIPGVDKWNNRFPPLPWQFEKQIDYQKAYGEWQGKVCVILPLLGLQCLDPKIGDVIDIIPNKWSDLYQYIPLANTTDKGGVQRIVGVQFQESAGTVISGQLYDGPNQKSAPLSFAHTQEVKELSELLNSTYSPQGYESEKQSETTEKLKSDGLSGSGFACTAVNVRTNPGDNLFPGDRAEKDTREMIIPGITYHLDSVKCVEKVGTGIKCNDSTNSQRCIPRKPGVCCPDGSSLTCNAEVAIVIKTILRAPNLDNIFATTTADSGSTFRKIFPKVEEGAPVSCIADIPGVSAVTYNADESDTPRGKGRAGTSEFKVTNYPIDGGGSGSELTFPHVGSIYEYFLKGIQTALRPKGYGEPLVNGICKPTVAECGEWESKLEKNSGGDCGVCTSELGTLAKQILATAGKTYNVPAANIWAAMKHEGADGYQGTTYDFKSDDNIRKWSNSIECGGEPMPACDDSNELTQPPFGFLAKWFYLGDGDNALWKAVQEIDPSRNSKEQVSRCNFLDAAFAAAKSLNQASSNVAAGLSCGSYSGFNTIGPGTCSSAFWTDSKVAQSHNGYAGFCVNDLAAPLYTIETAVGWFKDAKCN
jgi:hypothetical protein